MIHKILQLHIRTVHRLFDSGSQVFSAMEPFFKQYFIVEPQELSEVKRYLPVSYKTTKHIIRNNMYLRIIDHLLINETIVLIEN